MYFIDVIRGKNITFVYHKILYNMKEEELIEQMKNGNNIAFAALYDYYCQKVYNFTKLYVTSSDTVAEIVQDVFVKFWEARHLLDNNKKVEGFLLPGRSFLIKHAAGCAKICSKWRYYVP